MSSLESSPRELVERADVGIVMADGCRLSARIWMPADATRRPVPAILEHLPYRKRDGTVQRDALTHPWFAARGYACIRTDMRGNGDSEGLMEDEYTEREWQDAVEVIAWVAAQDWCDGTLGMMGISWGGFNALQVAALRPPALKAVITLCSTADRFADDIHYKGGCLLNENVGWAANMLSYSSRPPDPALLGEARARELWLERLEHLPFLASTWLRHQRRDAYWRHGSICEDYAALEAAVLVVGGWHDGYRNTPAELVANLPGPVKGIVGPWIHKYPHFAAPEPAIGFLQEALRWWDRWLKGGDSGVEADPAYRVWLMDSVAPARWLSERPGRWIAERTWPSPRIGTRVLPFGEGTLTMSSSGPVAGVSVGASARRSDALPSGLRIDIASPQDCGECAGEYFPFAFGPELPDEQSADDARSATFDGAPLEASLDIVGAPCVTLDGHLDAPTGFVAVRLCELRPDGTSALITMGMLNVAHRHAAEHPEPAVPGETMRLVVTLDQIAFRVPVGHRLRVALATSCWPFVWPAPSAVTFTLLAGSLALPVRRLGSAEASDGNEVTFEPPESAPPWRSERLREPLSTRETRRDPETGETTTSLVNDFGEYRDLEHGLRAGSATRERWSIRADDPLSARAEIRWTQTGGRDAWRWRTEALVQLHADADAFHLSGKLAAFENGKRFFERRYEDTIPREFV